MLSKQDILKHRTEIIAIARKLAEARRLWTESLDLFARIGVPHMVKKVQGWLDGLPPE